MAAVTQLGGVLRELIEVTVSTTVDPGEVRAAADLVRGVTERVRVWGPAGPHRAGRGRGPRGRPRRCGRWTAWAGAPACSPRSAAWAPPLPRRWSSARTTAVS